MPSLPTTTPNFVIFITDQQRAIQYFPEAWVQENLVNLNTLTNTGLTFTNAITNASRCSPSRGVLATSLYAPKNGLLKVDHTLPINWTTLGRRMHALGYQVGYVGKWHMTSSFLEAAQTLPNLASTLEDQARYLKHKYGTPGWDPPDAGTALGPPLPLPPSTPPTIGNLYVSNSNTLGGGPNTYNGPNSNPNDARFAQDAISFLQKPPSVPFMLIVSLVNPHDIWANMFLTLMLQAYPEFPAAFNALQYSNQFTLPASYPGDDLSTKPGIQRTIRNAYTAMWAKGNNRTSIPKHLNSTDALIYLKFYAYLTYLSDQQLKSVYQALQNTSQFDNTIVVRLADHGEMGMSHGGSMEKDCNVYAETINIPYIFSNPQMFPSPVTCAAQAGLVDIIPTLLGFLGKSPGSTEVQGTDLSPLILGTTSTPTSNCSIFTYDDVDTMCTWHIRAIQADPGAVSVNNQPTSSAYKFAVYYQLTQSGGVDPSSLEYELYVPGQEGEITNLATESANSALCGALYALLTSRMAAVDATGPTGPGTVKPSGWPSSYLPPSG